MTLKAHFCLFSSKAKPGNGKSMPMFVLDTSSSEKNEVEEPRYRFFSQVIICVFERSGCHFHDGFECRLNPADVVPLTSIRAVELRKIPKSKHKSASEAN